jgi:GT2 family glycosyltransferase
MNDHNKINIAILILFMEAQWNATKLTLMCISEVLPRHTAVSVLLNGGKSEIIQNEFKKMFPSFHFFSNEKNIGVAGGRNFLMNTQQIKDAKYIFHLDNDILLSKNYFEEMIHFLDTHPDAGVVGPLVFKANYLVLYLLEDKICPSTDIHPPYVSDSSRIITDWIKTGFPEPWHFGASMKWHLTYCSVGTYVINKLCKLIGIKSMIPTYHTFNTQILDDIKNKKKEILSSIVAGCSTLYRRQLIDDIGLYDESFNPYSLEDVEFCIRAMAKGYNNYINPYVALFHGTDLRFKNRKEYFSLQQKIKTSILLRRRQIKNNLRLAFSIFSYLFCFLLWAVYLSIKSVSFTPLWNYFLGSIEGIKKD